MQKPIKSNPSEPEILDDVAIEQRFYGHLDNEFEDTFPTQPAPLYTPRPDPRDKWHKRMSALIFWAVVIAFLTAILWPAR